MEIEKLGTCLKHNYKMKCHECGTIFTAEHNEITKRKVSIVDNISNSYIDKIRIVAICPLCRFEVTDVVTKFKLNYEQ